MPTHVLRRALLPSLGVLAALALFDARAAFAAKIKMLERRMSRWRQLERERF